MKLEKGMLICVDPLCYYVVVAWDDTHVYCICDNANNAYSWKIDHIEFYLSRQDIIDISYGIRKEGMHEMLINREIPYDVITEAVFGAYDKRFSYQPNTIYGECPCRRTHFVVPPAESM